MRIATTTLLTVNDSDILLAKTDVEIFIPIAPICTSLGLKTEQQLNLLKENQSLNKFISSVDIEYVGTDWHGVECLPIMWVFGWLFTVRNDQNYESVLEIYNAFMDYVKQCDATGEI